jgi:hypothetical protein
MKKMELSQMETVAGNGTWSKLCGAGIAGSLFTGLVGALIIGPPTIGMCMAAWFEKE